MLTYNKHVAFSFKSNGNQKQFSLQLFLIPVSFKYEAYDFGTNVQIIILQPRPVIFLSFIAPPNTA